MPVHFLLGCVFPGMMVILVPGINQNLRISPDFATNS
jgi:hypothetical protein